MDRPRRVLVLGASGLIGSAVLDAARGRTDLVMVAASHRERPGMVRVDYAALTAAADWVAVLRVHAADAVVNCVGIWSGAPEDFERLQLRVPVALFDACRAEGLRVVQVSALGFDVDSPLPYVRTKARADRALLQTCPGGCVVQPSLVFGAAGPSTRFLLSVAALPVQVDFGLARNLQPVHVREVARAVLAALDVMPPGQIVECAGPRPITMREYLDALRAGMGLGRAPLTVRLPRWCARAVFAAGERLGARYVNRQTWILLQAGTQSARSFDDAMAYERLAGADDLARVRENQLYWFARLGLALLWLWTAWVAWFAWPRRESIGWLAAVWRPLGTPGVLAASCLFDAAMGVLALLRPGVTLWKFQFAATAAYAAAMGWGLGWTWLHPLGPLTKNLAVLAVLAFLMLQQARRDR